MPPPEPCDECGGTKKRHNDGCSQYSRTKSNLSRTRKCGKTHDFAGPKPHLTHTCGIELTAGGRHAGSCLCREPGCMVTWG